MRKSLLLMFALSFVCHAFSQKRLDYNPQEIKNWSAMYNMHPKEYQVQYDRHKILGYDISFIDAYNIGDKVMFSAIWEKRKGPKSRTRHGLSGKDLKKVNNNFKKDGYKLVHIDGYSINSKAYYTAIWRKIKVPTRFWFGIKSDKYQEEVIKNKKDGYRLKTVGAYSLKGVAYYSAVWVKQDGPKQRLRHGLNKKEFSKAFAKNNDEGYKIVHIDSYKAGGTAKYAAIWEKRKGRYVAHSSLNEKNYQLRMENYHYQGYRPISVSGHDNAINKGYTAVWKQVAGWKSADTRQFDKKVRAIMDKYKIPGCAVAIVKDGELKYAKGYGYANKENKEIASATSLWRIASISKPITGVAIMKLTEDTNLSLEDKVFGPGALLGTTYGSKEYSSRERQINVRHLLEHRAGGNSWDNNLDADPGGSEKKDKWNAPMFNTSVNTKNHAETISWLLDVRNPSEPVNSITAYSNIGYCILGRVIEKKTGMKYEDYVKKNILEPIGITDMYIGSGYKKKRKYREAVYYDKNAYDVRPWRMDSHGGWVASVIDLMRFSVRVDGDPVKKDILKKETITTMQTSSVGDRFGKGWAINSSLMKHGGALPGTNCYLKLMNNGVYYVFNANRRPGEKEGDFVGDMNEAIEKGIKEIKNWPLTDLFESK